MEGNWSDWIEWKGGSRPVAPDTRVLYKLRDGTAPVTSIPAKALYWEKRGNLADVVAYKVQEVKPVAVAAHVDLGKLALEAATDQKDTNPKDAVGIRKTPFSVIPMPVLAEVGVGMLEGASKYGRHNWRGAGIRNSVYFDGTMRHLIAWWEGEDIDPDTVDPDVPDSGVSHITKAICSLMVLRDAMIRGMATDDRPPRSKDFFTGLNKRAGEILDKHKDKSPKHWTVDDDKQGE